MASLTLVRRFSSRFVLALGVGFLGLFCENGHSESRVASLCAGPRVWCVRAQNEDRPAIFFEGMGWFEARIAGKNDQAAIPGRGMPAELASHIGQARLENSLGEQDGLSQGRSFHDPLR